MKKVHFGGHFEFIGGHFEFKMPHIRSAACLHVIYNSVSHKQSVVYLINQNRKGYIEKYYQFIAKIAAILKNKMAAICCT